jgi:hypothetical protein
MDGRHMDAEKGEKAFCMEVTAILLLLHRTFS